MSLTEAQSELIVGPECPVLGNADGDNSGDLLRNQQERTPQLTRDYRPPIPRPMARRSSASVNCSIRKASRWRPRYSALRHGNSITCLTIVFD